MLDVNAVAKLNGPVILLFRKKLANHFVTLRSFSGRAFVTDPALGALTEQIIDDGQSRVSSISNISSLFILALLKFR